MGVESRDPCDSFFLERTADTLPPGVLVWKWCRIASVVVSNFILVDVVWRKEISRGIWRVDLSQYQLFCFPPAIPFPGISMLLLVTPPRADFLGPSWSDARIPMSSYAAMHPGGLSFQYPGGNALGSDGCAQRCRDT